MPCKQLFPSVSVVDICCFACSASARLLLATQSLLPVGNPLHGVWVGWPSSNTGSESSLGLAHQRTPILFHVFGGHVTVSSLGFFYRSSWRSHLGGKGRRRWSGAPAAIVPPRPPCWESLLAMEKENEQVTESITRVCGSRWAWSHWHFWTSQLYEPI